VSRVHAGETPASHMLKGILNFLMENSIDSVTFLNNFVLVIIPMMNPDGVFRGNYRLDS
jgi:murein tripeptide amidase MpaA